MQRKGGDGGRETAKMLQFKINEKILDIDNFIFRWIDLVRD